MFTHDLENTFPALFLEAEFYLTGSHIQLFVPEIYVRLCITKLNDVMGIFKGAPG